jgi:hypothetical protein
MSWTKTTMECSNRMTRPAGGGAATWKRGQNEGEIGAEVAASALTENDWEWPSAGSRREENDRGSRAPHQLCHGLASQLCEVLGHSAQRLEGNVSKRRSAGCPGGTTAHGRCKQGEQASTRVTRSRLSPVRP